MEGLQLGLINRHHPLKPLERRRPTDRKPLKPMLISPQFFYCFFFDFYLALFLCLSLSLSLLCTIILLSLSSTPHSPTPSSLALSPSLPHPPLLRFLSPFSLSLLSLSSLSLSSSSSSSSLSMSLCSVLGLCGDHGCPAVLSAHPGSNTSLLTPKRSQIRPNGCLPL